MMPAKAAAFVRFGFVRFAWVYSAALIGLFLCVALSPQDAAAQAYPSRRITLIVPYAPGGIVDLIGRMLATPLGERLGQPIVVENRPSVTGNVGVAAGAHAAADGYTITLIANANLISALAETKPPYNMVADFAPVAQLAEYYAVLVVNASLPAKNMTELIVAMKAKPGGITVGSSGIGSSAHVGLALLSQKAGVEALHVPYKGEGPLITALQGGEIDMAFLTTSGASVQLKSGKLRALGVTSPKRISEFPDIPTIAETLPGFAHVAWLGLAVPEGTPRDRIDLLNKEALAVFQTADIRQKLAARSIEVAGSTPDQFRQRIRSESEVIATLVKILGIKAQ